MQSQSNTGKSQADKHGETLSVNMRFLRTQSIEKTFCKGHYKHKAVLMNMH